MEQVISDVFETAQIEAMVIARREANSIPTGEGFETAIREIFENRLREALQRNLTERVRDELDRPIGDPRGKPVIEALERARSEERDRKQNDPTVIAIREEKERKEREAREKTINEQDSFTARNEGIWKSMPQYFASESREVRICHETGILCYDTLSSVIPVGQFIAPTPLSEENSKFSITIVAPGKIKAIGLGLVPENYQPDQQPGWHVRSIGYHADDGGIFIETGMFCNYTAETCDVGDTMEVEIDVQRRKGCFSKNGKKMFEFALSMFGLYPCVGFHSRGEAVKLNEKEVWAAGIMSDVKAIML